MELEHFNWRYFVNSIPLTLGTTLLSRAAGADWVVDGTFISFKHSKEMCEAFRTTQKNTKRNKATENNLF